MKQFIIILMMLTACTNNNPTGGGENMAFTSGVTWDNELVSDTKLNTMTANDDDLDTRVKKCLLAGANTTGHTRLSSGSKTGSLSSNNAVDVSITFATDCDLGDPSYDGTPRVIPSLEINSGAENLSVHVKSVTSTGFTARVVSGDGNNYTSTFTIYFIAVGAED